MERFFANAYRGDPGVPHSGPEPFQDLWIATALFTFVTWNKPYLWHFTNAYNYHDLAMLHEQYHLQKAIEKKQPLSAHELTWNRMHKEGRESYYKYWPTYFP